MEPEGWFLPKGDTYFAQFVPGPAPKLNGFQREHLLEAFEYVKSWRIAIDVGAHVGFWTWDMADRFERVFAFEPAPDTYDCLQKNIYTKGNVTTAQIAIGDRCGRAKVVDDKDRKGNTGSRFVQPTNDGESVPMISLDSLSWENCDLLKIDVEGFELQVLQGAKTLIQEHRPVIIMECDKKFSRPRYGIHPDTAEKFLIANKYRCVAHMRPDKIFIP